MAAFDHFNAEELRPRPGPSLGVYRSREALRTRDDRWTRGDTDPFDQANGITWERRMPPDDEYYERVDTLKQIGIKVKTSVAWSHLDRTPSLMIYVDALPHGEQPNGLITIKRPPAPDRFVRRHSRWTANEIENPQVQPHITIGKATDIETFPDFEHKLAHIYSKFDKKVLWLYPFNVTRGSTLELDPHRDPIASDPIIQEFHSRTLKYNAINPDEDDPGYNDPANWNTVVPALHISM